MEQSAEDSALREYSGLLRDVGRLLGSARRSSARAVNAFMTATYWEIGRRIVEFEQSGEERAEYGQELVKRLSIDLTARWGEDFPSGIWSRCGLSIVDGQFRRHCLRNSKSRIRRRRLRNSMPVRRLLKERHQVQIKEEPQVGRFTYQAKSEHG